MMRDFKQKAKWMFYDFLLLIGQLNVIDNDTSLMRLNLDAKHGYQIKIDGQENLILFRGHFSAQQSAAKREKRKNIS